MSQYPISNFTIDTINVKAGDSYITGSLYAKGTVDSASISTLKGTITLDQQNALNIGGYPGESFINEVTPDFPDLYTSSSLGLGSLAGNINILGLGSTADALPTTGSGLQFLTQWRGTYGTNQPYNTWIGHTYDDSDPEGLAGPIFSINASTAFTDRVNRTLLKYYHANDVLQIGNADYTNGIGVRGDTILISTAGTANTLPASGEAVLQASTVYVDGTLYLTGSQFKAGNNTLPLLGGADYILSYNTQTQQIGVLNLPVADNGGIQVEVDPVFTLAQPSLATTGSNTFTAQQTVNADIVVSQSKGLYANLVTENVTDAGIRYFAGTAGHMFTGSVNSLNGFTGSLNGTSSWASNALSADAVAFANITGKPSLISGSIQVDVVQTTNYDTLATTGSNSFVGDQAITGSFEASGSIAALRAPTIVLAGTTLYLNAPTLVQDVTLPNREYTPDYVLGVFNDYGLGVGYISKIPASYVRIDTSSLQSSTITGSLIVSGGLSTFNFVSGARVTPTGSFTTATPPFDGSEGQFLFGSGSNGYAMFVWIGGQWRSSSLS